MPILCAFIFRTASFLIPRGMRAEWLKEWHAEAWYVRENSPRCATLFCLGAYSDAMCVFRSTPRNPPILQSPLTCTLILAAICTFCVASIGLLPGGWSAMLPTGNTESERLVTLWRDGRPTISVETFLEFRERDTRRYLSAAALYTRPSKQHIEGGGEISLAVATQSFLDVLQIPQPPPAPNIPTVVLTRSAWREHFHEASGSTGSVLNIGGRRARLAAVISDPSWSLAGKIDAWMLDDEILQQNRPAFGLARLDDRQTGRIRLPLRLLAMPVKDRFARTNANFLFMTLIACVLLPVATTLSLGELPRNSNQRWDFFLLKLFLVLVTAYCVSAYMAHLWSARSGGPLLIDVFLVAYVLALRWVFIDQRRRCPVCLRRLSNPATVGESSRIFLGWNATELMCSRGHGLMHIPETPTSWFSVQRWSTFDSSWSGLFTR